MQVVRTRPALVEARQRLASPVGAVLTMGALHRGHLGLVRHAREIVGDEGSVLLTIFVNPLQVGPGEDLDRYPRSLPNDLEAAERAGVDLVVVPDVDTVYPAGSAQVTVDPGELGAVLEGAARPTHFRGVLTVVAKLLLLTRPSVTVFGEKDYQQLVLVRRMCRDLDLGVDVVGMATVRDDDGVALSSRIAYLTDEQRRAATAIPRALAAARDRAALGTGAALAVAHDMLAAEPDLDVDYLVVTDPDLGPVPRQGPARMLVAARLGSTRLLDNAALHIGEPA